MPRLERGWNSGFPSENATNVKIQERFLLPIDVKPLQRPGALPGKSRRSDLRRRDGGAPCHSGVTAGVT
jgi:hypothetical protein